MSESLEDIQIRLNTHIEAFSQKMSTLSQQHREICNSTQLTLITHLSLSTEKPCIPCGVIHLGKDTLLFGYRRGRDTSMSLEDTLRLYKMEKLATGYELIPLEKHLLDTQFIDDFRELSENFPEADLNYLFGLHDKKIALFKTETSVKVFWWHMDALGTVHYRGKEDNIYLPTAPEWQEDKDFLDGPSSITCPNTMRSASGEEILYIFCHQETQILLFYSKKAVQKIICRGHTLFDDGRLVVVGNKEDSPSQTHPIQIWQTPYLSLGDEHRLSQISQTELDRGLLEAHHLKELLQKLHPTQIHCENIIRFIHSLKSTFLWLAEDLQIFLETLHSMIEWIKNHDHPELQTSSLHEETTMLGQYRFQVNTQALEWVIVPYQDNQMAYHLKGTRLFEPFHLPQFCELIHQGHQNLAFESTEVYRGEYFAVYGLHSLGYQNLCGLTLEDLIEKVHPFVHTQEYGEFCAQDTAQILEKLLPLYHAAGLLRFTSASRALAQLFWAFYPDSSQYKLWEKSAKNLYRLQTVFNGEAQGFSTQLMEEFKQAISEFLENEHLSDQFSPQEVHRASEYLLEELSQEPLKFTASAEAMQGVEYFWKELEQHHQRRTFEGDLRLLKSSLAKQFLLTQAWLKSATKREDLETVVIVLTSRRMTRQVNSTQIKIEINNLVGQHPRIHEGCLTLQLDEFFDRLDHFMNVYVPHFHRYHQFIEELLREKNQSGGIHSPHPPRYFVQNHLIQEVYLNLMGENLTKQLYPIEGQDKPALLLLSPPGYGKTTLIEYVAYRLGLIYVRIDCSLLGAQVTSLDGASDTIARHELEKIHFALVMGQQVLLFLDHAHASSPEFLQKLVGREVVGIWKNQPITYRLDQQRFALVIAANLGTESLPESLLNCLQVVNLAYHVLEHEREFAQSLIENALVHHAVLAPLAKRDLNDVAKLIRLAQGEKIPIYEFSYPYSGGELQDVLLILRKLLQVHEVVNQVNQHYLASLMQIEPARQEPPFKLQGNYYTMTQLVTKLRIDMSEEEVEQMIDAYYLEQAYTLVSEKEENLLKFMDIRGQLTQTQKMRWSEIKNHFKRLQSLGDQENQGGIAWLNQLNLIGEGLQNIHAALVQVGEMKSLSVYLAALPKLVHALTKIQMNIEVINQLPSGWEESLRMMIDMVEKSLIPIVQEYERKSKLDLVMFERIKEISQILKEVQKEILAKGKIYKQYKALNLNKD